MASPSAVVLDVNETLFSLESLDPLFEEWGLMGQRDLWFARTLRNGFALTAAGQYRSFPEVARQALVSLAPDRISPAEADELLGAFGALEPHPEVRAALTALRDARVPVATLSVGNATNVERLFARAGLDDLVTTHLSCEQVSRWKPAPEPYRMACQVLESEPHETWMVAAHAWDLAGAHGVGMRTAWLSRLEERYDENFPPPDVTGADLLDTVTRLLDD